MAQAEKVNQGRLRLPAGLFYFYRRSHTIGLAWKVRCPVMKAFDRIASLIPLCRDNLLALPERVKSQAQDIHFKSGQPVAVCGREGISFLKPSVSAAQMQELFFHICGQSVFSHEDEIRQGYVQVDGLCRAGICGTAVLEGGRVKGLRDITSIVFRIPRDMPGCGDRLFLSGADLGRGALIAGEPGSGKTTLLRDIARSLSLGRFGPARRVAVLDSRGELGAFDLGPCADVLKSCPKGPGFEMALRSLSPEIILCDELAPGDLEAVENAAHAGVGLVATVHSGGTGPQNRALCRELLSTGAFGTLITLRGRESPCEAISVESVGERGLARESRAG